MRVLIIEDNPELIRSLAASLREEDFAVEYDVIVLDVMLPKLDGWNVIAALRRTHRTPVLMLTARDTVADRVQGLDRGADDYLSKPFDLDELLARIRALIRRTTGLTHSVVEIGDLVIDTARRRTMVAGAEVTLTAREYVLLEYLALHRGETVSRAELYEHLFDENDNTLSNLLDVHVSNLRRKLGRDLILTRRGHGYCIE